VSSVLVSVYLYTADNYDVCCWQTVVVVVVVGSSKDLVSKQTCKVEES